MKCHLYASDLCPSLGLAQNFRAAPTTSPTAPWVFDGHLQRRMSSMALPACLPAPPSRDPDHTIKSRQKSLSVYLIPCVLTWLGKCRHHPHLPPFLVSHCSLNKKPPKGLPWPCSPPHPTQMCSCLRAFALVTPLSQSSPSAPSLRVSLLIPIQVSGLTCRPPSTYHIASDFF